MDIFIFIFLYLVTLNCWMISIIFNDIEDVLQFKYIESIFDWIPKESWWSWYMKDPDDTWKRKYVWYKDIIVYRKKWGIFDIPAAFFDGWHGAKIIRQFFQFLSIFAAIMTGYFLPTLTIEIILIIFIFSLIIFSLVNYVTHQINFFNGIFLKKWWVDNDKTDLLIKIFNFLF